MSRKKKIAWPDTPFARAIEKKDKETLQKVRVDFPMYRDVYWPEFRRVDFLRTLRDFTNRERRFGR